MSGDRVLAEARDKMKKSIEAMERDLAGVRAGKASASLLDAVRVDYYGSMVPLQQVASINAPEARLIVVQPWEKTMVAPITKAIQAAALGLNPADDGTVVRVPVPPLTEERRKDLVRRIKQLGEAAKVSVRQVRREANEGLKKLQNDKEISEDEAHRLTDEVQQLTDGHVKKVDAALEAKESAILEI